MNYAVIKLLNGEELIAMVEEAPNPTELILHKPVLVNRNNSSIGPYMQVSHWLMFTKNNKATIKKQNVVALEYELEDNAIKSYKDFVDNKTGPIPLSDKGRLRELLDELSEANLNMEEDVLEDVLTDSSSNTTIH